MHATKTGALHTTVAGPTMLEDELGAFLGLGTPEFRAH